MSLSIAAGGNVVTAGLLILFDRLFRAFAAAPRGGTLRRGESGPSVVSGCGSTCWCGARGRAGASCSGGRIGAPIQRASVSL